MHRPAHPAADRRAPPRPPGRCRPGPGRAPPSGRPRRSHRRSRPSAWSLRPAAGRRALDGDDADEIRATIGLIEARVKFGIHERLRKFLLPLVAAVERQLEEAEKDLKSANPQISDLHKGRTHDSSRNQRTRHSCRASTERLPAAVRLAARPSRPSNSTSCGRPTWPIAGDLRLRNRLVEHYLPFVHGLARSIARGCACATWRTPWAKCWPRWSLSSCRTTTAAAASTLGPLCIQAQTDRPAAGGAKGRSRLRRSPARTAGTRSAARPGAARPRPEFSRSRPN